MMSARQALGIVADALRPSAGGPAAAIRRRAVGDWTRPLALANAHLLSPALYAGLAEAGALADLPHEAREYLGLLYRLNRDRNEALRHQAIELLAALNAAGVYPLLLKGGLSLSVPSGSRCAVSNKLPSSCASSISSLISGTLLKRSFIDARPRPPFLYDSTARLADLLQREGVPPNEHSLRRLFAIRSQKRTWTERA